MNQDQRYEGSFPVNKSHGESPDKRLHKLPHINSRAAMTALAAVRIAVRNVLGNIKPTPVPGRNERFRQLLTMKLQQSPLYQEINERWKPEIRVDVNQAFGKPTLVSLDLLFLDPEKRLRHTKDENRKSLAVIEDQLLELVEEAWDNPEIAPIAVRARAVAEYQRTSDLPHSRGAIDALENESLILDLADMGFTDEIARAEDLYARFGSPAADPHWHP